MPYSWWGLFVVLALTPAPARRHKHIPQKPKKLASASASAAAADAGKLLATGLDDFENEHSEPALQQWRRAEHEAPRSPLPHLFISLATPNPREAKSERARAQALAARGTKREQLWVKWLAGMEEEHYVPAIVAMNDLLAAYPADKHAAFLAGRWLNGQEEYEAAGKQLQRATEMDGNYAAAWKQLAYSYANLGDFSHAFAAMERCTALQPRDASAQASYAQILRLAGDYRDALAHYHQALQIDPSFQAAQGGIADTYALMGEESTARAEYEKAMRQAGGPAQQMEYAMESAASYVREKKAKRAVAALEGVASQAGEDHLPVLQAEAFRQMALVERDNQQSLRFLDKATSALAGASATPTPEYDQERAEVLRERALRLAASGDAAGAAQALQQLQQLKQLHHGAALERCYAGAMGGVLVTGQKYAQAIPYLEEDDRNPLSMRELIVAYSQAGAADRAHVMEMKLAAFNEPTLEQALVVPELRSKLAATKEKRGWLRKLMGWEQ